MDNRSDRVDWPLFLRSARFHRVQGLVWHSLHSAGVHIPDAIALHLRSDTEAIVAANLAITAESRALRLAFDAAGIELLFVKGLTLAVLAYSSPMLKMGWDIDLLIDGRSLQQAAKLLRDRGYQQVLPRSADSLFAWHRDQKESVWKREELHLELHTRLADNPRLIPSIGTLSPRQEVQVLDRIALPTLARDELFAYLAVHGASSAWFRLKWISDFAALLATSEPEEINRLHLRSQQLGAGRAAGQALLLADSLFGTLRAVPDLREHLAADRPTRLIHRAALNLVTGEPAEPTERFGGTFPIHWTQFLLMPGLGYKMTELSGQLGRLGSRFA